MATNRQTDIHTYACVQCSHASVGLAQARPNQASSATLGHGMSSILCSLSNHVSVMWLIIPGLPNFRHSSMYYVLKHKPRSKKLWKKLYTTLYNLLQKFTHHPVLLSLSLVTVPCLSVAVVSLSWLASSQEGWLLLVSHSQTPGVSCKDQECVNNREWYITSCQPHSHTILSWQPHSHTTSSCQPHSHTTPSLITFS